MSGAYKTVATDELVTKYSKKNKLTDGVQAVVEQSPKQNLTVKNKLTQIVNQAKNNRVEVEEESVEDQKENTELTVPEFTFGTKIEDYSSYLEQMYDAKKQAAMVELKNAYDNSVAELDRAETGLAEGYQAVRNETVGSHEQARRNFAEFAAANGLNHGAAGQAELSRGVTLQNNMNTIRTAEANAMADLTLKRAEAENEYNAAIAQAEYTGEYELAAVLYEEKVRVQEALIEAEIREQQYALERYKLQYQAQRDAVADQQYEREQALELQKYQDSLALQQAAQALKEKDQADSSALAWAAQALKEKDQSDSNALAQAAQALKEKEQAEEAELAWAAQALKEKAQEDEMELAWAELTKEEQQDLAAQALAQKKQEDAAALAWAKQELAQKKYSDSQTKTQKTGTASAAQARGSMGILTGQGQGNMLSLKSVRQ